MRITRLMMGMPITIEIRDPSVTSRIFTEVFAYFDYIDHKFSPFKPTSEVSRINSGSLARADYSTDMQTIIALCDQTQEETYGFFNPVHDGKFNPSGLVKGWAIHQAANLIARSGFINYYVDVAGDIQTRGPDWKIGIRNPFDTSEIVKVLSVNSNEGVATSGTYERGQHVYNPKQPDQALTDIVSLTVVGPNVYEADRFATAAFAMQKAGINLIESLPGFEGYMINAAGIATYTTSFKKYAVS